MASSLPENLRLLCSYHKSIAEVCRQLKISRPQFNRYLNGTTEPSLRLMRRICDFFGVEQSELLLPHAEFAELIRMKPAGDLVVIDRNRPFAIAEEIVSGSNEALSSYWGYYFVYYNSMSNPGRILRGLACLAETENGTMVKIIEPIRARDEGERGFVCKYEGVAYVLNERLFFTALETLTRNEAIHVILYPNYKSSIQYLSGIQSGVSALSTRAVGSTRVVYQFLGRDIDKLNAIRQCGLFDYGDDRIPSEVQSVIGGKGPHQRAELGAIPL